MDDAGKVADEDAPAAHRRRRLTDLAAGRVFPAKLACLEIECEQFAGARPDVDGPVGDCRGRLDDVSGFVGPLQGQLLGERVRGDARQLRVPAELSPAGISSAQLDR